MVSSHDVWSRSQKRERDRMKSLRLRICRRAARSVHVAEDARDGVRGATNGDLNDQANGNAGAHGDGRLPVVLIGEDGGIL